MKKATQQQSKEHNRNLALKTIFEHSSISRAEIARLTGLTRTTVSDIVADLIDEGLVEEVGIGASQGGKSPFSWKSSRTRVISSAWTWRTANSEAQSSPAWRDPRIGCHTLERQGCEGALAILFDMLDHLYQAQYRPLIGIGVGTPGW